MFLRKKGKYKLRSNDMLHDNSKQHHQYLPEQWNRPRKVHIEALHFFTSVLLEALKH
jgi:hypothetical protein